MPESKSSDPGGSERRDLSAPFTLAGIAAMALGAGLFHPGAGLILAGLALTAIGFLGGARRT